uniref:Astacin domain-containing protein n=1 Tax=Strongyloides papillosus TaxID=174720 RepID=A0A0N5CII8_STREA
MKNIKLLSTIILVYYTITGNNVFGKKNNEKTTKKSSTTTSAPITDSFKMNTTIAYSMFEDIISIYDKNIDYAIELIQSETCLNFIKINHATSTDVIYFRFGYGCFSSIILDKNNIYFQIDINQDCSSIDKIRKLVYWVLEMKYEMDKCFQNNMHDYKQGPLKGNNITEVLKNYKCDIRHLSDESYFLDPEFIGYRSYKVLKTNGIEPKNMEQINYSSEFSFLDLKALNNKMCKDYCKNESPKYCSNNGLRQPKNCAKCLCPSFYTGKQCQYLEQPKNPKDCGSQSITAYSKGKTKTLDFNNECYYNIKPMSAKKKVLLKFTPLSSVYWDCDRYKIIEIKYLSDKSKDGVIPCGDLRNFTVKGDKGTKVFMYTSKIHLEFKLKMEYKEVVN